MKSVSKFLFKWMPRVIVGGTAVALLILFVTQFGGPPSLINEPNVEQPAVESPPANVTTVGDTTITLEADLTADPGEVLLYRAQLELVVATPEDALARAHAFGLPDPEVYRPANESNPVLFVLSSDGQRLAFHNYGGFGEIYYTNLDAEVTGNEAISFEEAADVAVAFLQEHNALPEAYQVDPLLGDSGPVRQVIVRPRVEGGIVDSDTSGAGLRVAINAAGQIMHASLSHLILEPAGTTAVVSAQDAYEDLLNNRNVLGSTYSMVTAGSVGYRYYQPPLPAWEVGQTVDLVGYLEVLVNAQTGEHRLALMSPAQGTYLLTGRSIDELNGTQGQWGNVQVQGTITAQDRPGNWQVAVENWELASPLVGSCLIGTLTRSGATAQFRSEDGAAYGLPHAPQDIAESERMEICLAAPAEPGDDLAWFNIRIPPHGDGPPPGGVVSEQVVVEQVEEVAVTRVVVEEVTVEGDSDAAEAVDGPEPTAVFVEPTSPYEIGDEVETTGVVQFYRIVDEEGEERLEATFADEGNQEEATYPFSYLLLAEPELLEEMAEFNGLHVRVYGRVVPAPDNDVFIMSGAEQAIAADRFDRPWPDEKKEHFLGHFSLEEVEGRQVLLFTDHATDQRYVINPPALPPAAYGHDPAVEDEQVLLTGIVHPVNTFGGLPLLERRGTRTGTDVAQATEISQFPLEEYDTIPVINEAQMAPRDGLAGNLRGEVIIERVELIYPYRPRPPQYGGDDSEPEPQLLEPVWAFYGRSVDGRQQFIIHVRATSN